MSDIDDKTLDMFGNEQFDWRKEWQAMPLFEQEDLKPVHQILFSFRTAEDMLEFSKLIGYDVKFSTKSVVYPVVRNLDKKVWVDDES